MRFGISATSLIDPNFFRMRLRPLNVSAMSAPQSFARVTSPRPAACVRGPPTLACPRNRSRNGSPEGPFGVASTPKDPPEKRSIGSGQSGGRQEALFSHCQPPIADCLLHFHRSALILELLLELCRLILGDAFLHGLAAGLDEVLGFLEAEAGDGANLFDDVDLLLAASLQDDGELGLLLGRGSRSARSRGNGNGCCRRHAPLFLEQLG